MPKKEFSGGGKTEFIRTLDGRRAVEHHYDDKSDEEVYALIDARRNVAEPTELKGGENTLQGNTYDEEG